jgi:hypothetical protein
MPTASRYRTIVCLSAVLLIHLLIFAALNVGRVLYSHRPETVSTVWMIPEVVPPKVVRATRPADMKSVPRPARPVVNAIASKPEAPSETLTETPTPPSEVHLDLDSLRAQAVQQEISRKKSPVELANEANQKNHSFETQVDESVDKAKRDDCRTAYSGAGLLAVIPIAADLIRGKGCKF